MSELKYKKGDEVVILPWGLMEQGHGLKSNGYIDIRPAFTTEMEQGLSGTDRITQIISVGEDYYRAKIDSEWMLCDEMILGYAFEWGQEIEVRDSDARDWRKRKFAGYVPGFIFAVNTFAGFDQDGECSTRDTYKFARPIHKPDIEPDIKITVKRDGKELTVDELTKLTVEEIKVGLSHG